mgnify:CR=1 FL=1
MHGLGGNSYLMREPVSLDGVDTRERFVYRMVSPIFLAHFPLIFLFVAKNQEFSKIFLKKVCLLLRSCPVIRSIPPVKTEAVPPGRITLMICVTNKCWSYANGWLIIYPIVDLTMPIISKLSEPAATVSVSCLIPFLHRALFIYLLSSVYYSIL